MSENWKDASDVIVAEFEDDGVVVQVLARKDPDGDGLQVSTDITWDFDYDPYGDLDSEVETAAELLYPYLKRWRQVLIDSNGDQNIRDEIAQINYLIRELKASNSGLL